MSNLPEELEIVTGILLTTELRSDTAHLDRATRRGGTRRIPQHDGRYDSSPGRRVPRGDELGVVRQTVEDKPPPLGA